MLREQGAATSSVPERAPFGSRSLIWDLLACLLLSGCLFGGLAIYYHFHPVASESPDIAAQRAAAAECANLCDRFSEWHGVRDCANRCGQQYGLFMSADYCE